MLRNCLVLISAIAVMGLPNSASADVCRGLFSWLCSRSDSSRPAPDAAPRKERPADDTGLDRSAAARPSPAASHGSAVGSPCLAREEIHGGYPRYRLIHGQHCWYASTKSQQRMNRQLDAHVDDNPISRSPETARAEPTSCELQALKLDAGEKKIFMKQCVQ